MKHSKGKCSCFVLTHFSASKREMVRVKNTLWIIFQRLQQSKKHILESKQNISHSHIQLCSGRLHLRFNGPVMLHNKTCI